MAPIRILLADNNLALCQLLEEYLNQQEDMEVVGKVFDGVQALEAIEGQDPDVILLDVTMPQLDGLAVMERLPQLHLSTLPHVIVLTAFGREDILQRFTELGADYFIVKPVDLELLTRRVREFGRQPRRPLPSPGNWSAQEAAAALASDTATAAAPADTSAPRSLAGLGTTEMPASSVYANAGLGVRSGPTPLWHSERRDSARPRPEVQVTLLLHQMGVPPHFKGFMYLRDAVLLTLSDETLIGGGLTKELYPRLGQQHAATAGAVEAAIRNAITAAWQRGNRAFMQELISGTSLPRSERTPTNSLVIAKLADRIRLGDLWPVAAQKGEP